MKSPDKTDVLTQNDIDKIAGLLDKTFDSRLAPLATKTFVKEELGNLKVELKDYIHEGVEMVTEGLDRISEQLAVGEKVGVKLKI